jgi:hypothetical protein
LDDVPEYITSLAVPALVPQTSSTAKLAISVSFRGCGRVEGGEVHFKPPGRSLERPQYVVWLLV